MKDSQESQPSRQEPAVDIEKVVADLHERMLRLEWWREQVERRQRFGEVEKARVTKWE